MVAYKTNNIKALRRLNNLTQEQMAEKMHMSKSGYANIERGDNNVSLEHLRQLADIFNVDVVKLIEEGDQGLIVLIGDNSVADNSKNNYYNDSQTLASEIEKLKLIINHKDELLKKEQKDNARLEKEIAKKDEQIDALMKKLTD